MGGELLADLQQAKLPGAGDRLSAIARLELAKDVIDVLLNRANRGDQSCSDLLIRQIAGHQTQHFQLALGERIQERRWNLRAGEAGQQRIDEQRRYGAQTREQVDDGRICIQKMTPVILGRSIFDGLLKTGARSRMIPAGDGGLRL